MPFVCVVKKESSCESRPVPIPAVTLMKNPAVRASAPEENSEQSRLTDAVRQREQVWQWIANVQQTVSRQGQLSLAWLTGVRNDLWTAYAKFNNLHNQVIALVPDDVIKEQSEVYHSFEQVFFNVASSVEEMKLEAINQNPSPSGRDAITPANDSRKIENPLTSRFSKRCYATFERPSLFNKALPRQCHYTESDVHSRTQARKSSEKQTESIVVVPGKSTAAAEDVATNANLKSFALNVIVRPNPPDDLTVGLPTSEHKRHQRDENSSCVLGDSSAKVKGLSLTNHDLRRDHTDGVSKKMYVSSPIPVPPLSAVMPVPAEEHSPKDYRVNQDGSSIGENDPLLSPAVKAPDKVDPLHITPSDYQPRSSCILQECRQPCTYRDIPRNLTQFRITEAVIQSICQAIRERELQPPVCVNLKTSRSCVPISHSESVASMLTSDKHINPDTDGRCPPRRITVCYTPNVDVRITLKLFLASSLKKPCRTDVPNQFTCNDKQQPTRSYIIQPSLKDSSFSDHSRGCAPHEFRETMRKRAIEAPYAFSRKNHSNAPQLRIYWIDPDEPPDNYESRLPLAVDGTVARILTRPWDPGTNSSTSTIC